MKRQTKSLWLIAAIYLAVFFVWLLAFEHSEGAVVKGLVNEDSYTDSLQNTTNFGSAGTCWLGRKSGAPSTSYSGWLEDNLVHTLAATDSIDSVRVKIYFKSTFANPAMECSLWRCSQNAVEAQLTWLVYSTGNSWTSPGGDFDTFMGTATVTFGMDAYLNFNLNAAGTRVFQRWLEQGTGTNFGMIMTARNQDIYHDWFSSEDGTTPDSVFINYHAGAFATSKSYWGGYWKAGR